MDNLTKKMGRWNKTKHKSDEKRRNLFNKGLLVRVSLLLVISMVGQSAHEQDSLTEQEKQDIRAADRKNPAEAEQIIQHMNKDRRQAWHYKTHPEDIDRELGNFMENLRRANKPSSGKEFTEARTAFQNRVRWFENQSVRIPIDTANKTAEALLDIYEQRATYTRVPDFFPTEYAAKHANSPRVRTYLLGKIRSGSKDEKTFALTCLAWSKSFGGDAEMFTELEKLYNIEGQQNPIILGVMSRIDREKALPLVLYEINTTNDISLFTKDEDTLSEYGRVDLLDHALKRIKDFPRTSWTSDKNPTLGIYPDLLLQYVQNAEGDRLQLGLDALEQNIGALLKAYPVIKEKLGSAKPEDRRATAKFINRMNSLGRFRDAEVLRDLQERIERESDPETRKHSKETVERLSKGLKR